MRWWPFGKSAPNPTDLPEPLRRLDVAMQEHRAKYRRKLAPGLDPAQLDSLFGARKVPALFKAWFAWANGQADGDGRLYAFWMLMAVDDVLREEAGMAELQKTLMADGFTDGWRPGWYPFLKDGSGDCVILDMTGAYDGTRGQILVWTHEGMGGEIIAPSFEAWLERVAIATEMGLNDDGNWRWDALEPPLPTWPQEFEMARGAPAARDKASGKAVDGSGNKAIVSLRRSEPHDSGGRLREGLNLIGVSEDDRGNPARVVEAVDRYLLGRRSKGRDASPDPRDLEHLSTVLGVVVGQQLRKSGWEWVTIKWSDNDRLPPMWPTTSKRHPADRHGLVREDESLLVLPIYDVAEMLANTTSTIAFAVAFAKLRRPEDGTRGALKIVRMV